MTSIKNYYKDYADYMLQEQIKRDMVNTDVSNLFKMWSNKVKCMQSILNVDTVYIQCYYININK